MADLTKSAPAKSRGVRPLFDWAISGNEPMSWLREEIDRVFQDFGRPARQSFGSPVRGPAPIPALEFTENEKSYYLSAELPGLSRDDIDISIADGVLTLSGEKKEEREEASKGFHMSERRYGTFERQVTLPADINPDLISAQFKDGILKVTLAKDEKASGRARKIEVQ